MRGERTVVALSVLATAAIVLSPNGAPRFTSFSASTASRPAIDVASGQLNTSQMPPDRIDALPAFFDATVPRIMNGQHLAATAVAIVRDRRTILLRGYGTAQLETAAAVDPERTRFRIGSVTTVFTEPPRCSWLKDSSRRGRVRLRTADGASSWATTGGGAAPVPMAGARDDVRRFAGMYRD
jgi:hypothetical protein